jgi:ParB/RepB/Spo0J family partition protein
MLKKPLSWFKTAKQIREVREDADLRRLGESMKVHGQLQPVVAKPDGTILCGERRYRAAQLVGMTELSVVIADRPLSDSEVKIIQLIENIHRADLKAIEQVDGLEELARLNPGMNNKDLAELLNIDPSMVTRLRSVARCIPSVREALAAGAIGISDCYALSKADEHEQTRLLALKLSGGVSRDDLERAGRKKRNGTAPAVKMSRVKIAMPNNVSVVLSGNDLSIFQVVELLAATLKEARKAADQYDVKTWVSMMKDKAKAE